MTSVIEDPGTSPHLAYLTSYTYNILDQLTQVTQGSQTRSYVYDGLGRLTSSTSPEAGMVCFGTVSSGSCQNNGYDSWNNLTTRTDSRGVVTNYTFDTLNRPYQTTYNVGTTGVVSPGTVTNSYGTSPSSNNNGRLISTSDGSGSETFTYDILGRITGVSKVVSGTTFSVAYSYNLANDMSQITYPSGRVVAQNTDAIGRICAIGASGSTCTSGSVFANGFVYNASQQAVGYNLGNGVAASVGYSADRLQLSSISYSKSSANLFSLTYGYGSSVTNNGQITAITDNVAAGRSVGYTYDALGRLATASTSGDSNYPQWGLSWVAGTEYDRYGNRTSQTVTAGSAPANSLVVLAASNHISGSGFGYDANGNMTGDGVNTLTYDAENRTIAASGPFGAGAYIFDAKGLRVEKCLPNCTSPTTKTVYVFSGSKVIAEYDNGVAVGSPSREYIYSGGRLISTIDSTGTKYHLADHLSPRVTTDSSGNVVGQQGHYPFGEQWYASSTTTKWFFSSYERDPETENDCAHARDYVNRIGHFASPDPLAGNLDNPQSLNRYTYAANVPVDFVDPSGMSTQCSMSQNRRSHIDSAGDTTDGPSDLPAERELEEAAVPDCGGGDCWAAVDFSAVPCDLAFGGGGGSGSESTEYQSVGGDGMSDPIYNLPGGVSSSVAQAGSFAALYLQSDTIDVDTLQVDGLEIEHYENGALLYAITVMDDSIADAVASNFAGLFVQNGGTNAAQAGADNRSDVPVGMDIWHCPGCANIWQQTACTINGPVSGIGGEAAGGTAYDAYAGAFNADAGIAARFSGAVEAIKVGTASAMFGIWTYAKTMKSIAVNMVTGCH